MSEDIDITQIDSETFDDLTLNQLRAYYLIICKALIIAAEEKHNSYFTDGINKEDMVESEVTEWLEEAQEQLGLEFMDMDTISMQ